MVCLVINSVIIQICVSFSGVYSSIYCSLLDMSIMVMCIVVEILVFLKLLSCYNCLCPSHYFYMQCVWVRLDVIIMSHSICFYHVPVIFVDTIFQIMSSVPIFLGIVIAWLFLSFHYVYRHGSCILDVFIMYQPCFYPIGVFKRNEIFIMFFSDTIVFIPD